MAKGTISLRTERCKGCAFCVEFCPPRVLGLSATFNAKGYHVPELVDPDKCTGCDLCGMYCPDFAIHGYRFPKPPAPAATPIEDRPEPAAS
ncbi:MAG: 4Fe-4S binding protein [Bryobacterales bacterium]|nr:4Fe-4S binding protein [Bryobacterales bacterium]